MKTTSKTQTALRGRSGRLRPEYKFDDAKARPNRFAGRGSSKSVVVLLDPDVAKVFKSADSVNSALRAILAAVPARLRRKGA
jgi:hypothetical protein